MDSNTANASRRLKVFLCHSSGDKEHVRQLYSRLKEDGFQPWLDEIDLTPGVSWRDAIDEAVRTTDAVVVCLSRSSVSKDGFLQKEIKIALDVADEKTEGTIFVIPVRLEEVDVPRRLRNLQWANLYDPAGYDKLFQALRERAQKLSVPVSSGVVSIPKIPPRNTVHPSLLQAITLWMQSHFLLLAFLLLVLATIVIAITVQLRNMWQNSRVTSERKISQAFDNLKAFNVGEAQTLLREALVATPDNPLAHADLAVAFAEGGKYSLAQADAKIGLAHARSLRDNQRLWVAGVSQEVTWQLDEAAQSYREAWAKYKNPEAALRLAHVLTLAGKPSDSLQILSALETSVDPSSDPRIDYEKAQAADGQNDLNEELRVLRQIRESHPSEPMIDATALSGECWALYQQSKLDEADKACENSFEFFDKANDQLGRARVLTRESLIVDAGHPINSYPQKSAMELQTEAFDIAHQVGSELDQAGALQNLGNLLVNVDHLGDAKNDYDAARDIFTKIGNKPGLQALENNWAVSLANSCHYEEARGAFESVARNTPDPRDLAKVISNVGSMDYFLGNLAQSEAELTTALQKSASSNSELDPSWLTTLGDVEMAQNKLELAEACFRGIICTGTVGSGPPDWNHHDVLPDALLEYGVLQIEQHKPGVAEQIARKRIAAKQPDPEDRAIALDVLTRSLIARNAAKNAEGFDFEGAKDKVQSCWLKVSLLITEARVLSSSRHFDRAQQRIADAITESDKHKLNGYKLEALLAQAQIEIAEGQRKVASQHAAELRRIADASGFKLVALKASLLLSGS